MRPDAMIWLYVVGLLGAVAVVAGWEVLRRRRFLPGPAEDRIFRCSGCGYVYTDDPDVDRSRCPQCGTLNATVKF